MGPHHTLTNLIKNHGFSGLVAFVKTKIGFTKSIQLKNVEHKITLRPNTSDITTFKHIFAHGDYDFILKPKPKLIIDAGANIGLASIYFANRYPSAKIIAVELAPSNFQLLLKNISNYNQIHGLNAGLWHKNELLKFKDEGVSHWGYKVDNSLAENGVHVKSLTILDLIEKFNISVIDLLKIDIEGAEVEVFSENYDKWLPLVRYLMIEFHDRWRSDSSQTVRSALNNFNFIEHGMVGENVVFINNDIEL